MTLTLQGNIVEDRSKAYFKVEGVVINDTFIGNKLKLKKVFSASRT